MRSPTFAHWSQGNSFIHSVDARVKLILLVAFLVSIAALRNPSAVQLASVLVIVIAIAISAGLPVLTLLRTSLLIVPFVGLFAVLVYLSGDARRAWFILAKAYLSGLWVLIIVSSSPVLRLLAAARWLGTPALLVEVTQLIYRYIFVLLEEVSAMQRAFVSRGGNSGRRAVLASSGMAAVLFGRSYERAGMLHQAMLSRGYSGTLQHAPWPKICARDYACTLIGLAAATVPHFL